MIIKSLLAKLPFDTTFRTLGNFSRLPWARHQVPNEVGESERPSTQDLKTLMVRPRSTGMGTTWGKRRRVRATDRKRRIASSINQRARRDKESATKTGHPPSLHQWSVICSKRAATIRPNKVGRWLPRFWSHHHV